MAIQALNRALRQAQIDFVEVHGHRRSTPLVKQSHLDLGAGGAQLDTLHVRRNLGHTAGTVVEQSAGRAAVNIVVDGNQTDIALDLLRDLITDILVLEHRTDMGLALEQAGQVGEGQSLGIVHQVAGCGLHDVQRTAHSGHQNLLVVAQLAVVIVLYLNSSVGLFLNGLDEVQVCIIFRSAGHLSGRVLQHDLLTCARIAAGTGSAGVAAAGSAAVAAAGRQEQAQGHRCCNQFLRFHVFSPFKYDQPSALVFWFQTYYVCIHTPYKTFCQSIFGIFSRFARKIILIFDLIS